MHRDISQIRKKRAFKRKLYSKLVLIVLLVMLVFVLHGTWDVYKKSRLSKEKLDRAQAEYEQVEAKRSNLQEDLEQLQTETGIEAAIRSKFDVAREGEHVIVLVDGEAEATSTEEQSKGIKGFFTTLFSWFQ